MAYINGKWYSENELKRIVKKAESDRNSGIKVDDLLVSAAVGALTGSTVIGGLVGGSFLGGLIGDSLEGTDDSWL